MLKNQWRVILVLLLVLIVAIFAITNVASVPVNFVFGTVKWPLILVILGSLILGALITFLVSTVSTLQVKKQFKTLQSQYDNLKKQGDQEKETALNLLEADYQAKLEKKDNALKSLQKAQHEALPTDVKES